MKPCETLSELRAQFRGIKSACAQDTIFIAKAMMFLCERETQRNGSHSKKKRKPTASTAWNKFFVAGMKAGKSAKQVGEEWRARKD